VDSPDPLAETHTVAPPKSAATATLDPRAGPAATSSYAPSASARAAFDEEIRVLLRARLTVTVSAACAVYAVFALTTVAGDPNVATFGSRAAVETPLQFLMLGVCLTALLWLRRTPGASLPALRRCEVFLFGLMSTTLAALKYLAFLDVPGPMPDGTTARLAVERATAVTNLSWMVTIVYYGALIPNTRSRGLRMVCAIGVLPLLATLAAAGLNTALRPHLPFVLSVTAIGMFTFGVVAVFSAARVNQLQRQAFEAERRAGEVGPYTLKKKLGAGGMGEVWLAEHRLLKRPCAVKFVRADLAANPATAARFEREVRAVTTLTHFNTIRVYDYGRADDGSFYYVMEYLDGPTLDALVRQSGPLNPGRAVYLLRQLCGALAEAHAGGMVHRDLKPGNILVAALGGQRDVAKLLDFGLVHDLSADADARLTQTGVVMGTPAFMCPEQASGSGAVDARGDLYSLGAVAFFVLTGRPPFDGANIGALIAAHLTRPAPDVRDLRPDVPADLAAVVARCLTKDPKQRFQSAAELDAALAACACATDWNAAAAEKWWTEAPAAVPAAPTVAFRPSA
jgi:serine/threonine-protein kinase